jgi:LPXTG-motif cell wall-anchored protein
VLTADQLTNLTDGSDNPDTPPEPPLAPTVTPADDATGVAVGANLTLAFNRAPTAGTGNIEIHRTDDDSTVATIAAGDTDRVSISGSTVTVNPAANLNASTAYYVLIDADAFKDSDGDFYVGISDPTAWSFTTAAPAVSAPTSSENDGDGIDESVEAAAPNNGDANDDGVPDSAQPNVSSFPNPGTGGYVSVAVNADCTLSNLGMSSLSSGAGDHGFTYPAGLVDFTANCAASASTIVTVYFNDPPDGDLVVRKYDPSTNTFTSVDNAKLTRRTIGGKPVAVASYVVVDGGPLDSDHVVNGSVVDPVGLAQAVDASPAASPAPAGTTPAAPAAPAAGADELPYTGAKAVPALTAVATVLTTAGLLMLLAARRRRDDLRAEAGESD